MTPQVSGRSLLSVFFLLIAFSAFSQPAADSAKKQINILHADRISYKKVDSLNEYQILAGNVSVLQDKTLFYCDSAAINTISNIMESYGHVHINDNDSLNIYSDYLKYLGKEGKATLTGNVKLTDGKGTLTTSKLDYDLQTHIGNYYDGGKVVNGKTVLTSKEAFYYEDTRDVYFKKDVILTDPSYNIKTDTLLYNTYTGVATFTVPTTITSDSGKTVVKTKDGFYDTKNKRSYFGKRAEIWQGATYITADEMANDSTGLGEARGKVIYKDTAQHVSIYANHLNTNRKNGSFLATEKPVMIIVQNNDSTFVAADTLYSARLSDLKKYRNVPVIVQTAEQLAKDTAAVAPPVVEDTATHAPPPGVNENTDYRKDSTVLKQLAERRKKIASKDSLQTKQIINDTAATIPQTIVKTDSVSADTTIAKRFADKTKLIKKDSAQQTIDDTTVIVKAFTDTTSSAITKGEKLRFLTDTTTTTANGNDSTDRFFEAYYHVRIYSDSMQAVGDSMFYSGQDSVFRLFKQPIVWARESQVTGDTIYLFTQNKKPSRMYVFENALSINKVGAAYYNQIKGRTINGYFKNGNIDFMRTKGNAESIYYAQDEDNKFIGVNRATSDIIDSYFQDKKPQKVVFRSNLVGTTYPMRQVNHEELRLRGFKWLEELRPKSKYELFAD